MFEGRDIGRWGVRGGGKKVVYKRVYTNGRNAISMYYDEQSSNGEMRQR